VGDPKQLKPSQLPSAWALQAQNTMHERTFTQEAGLSRPTLSPPKDKGLGPGRGAATDQVALQIVELLKEQLKLMYGVGLAHLVQHLPAPALKDASTGKPLASELTIVQP